MLTVLSAINLPPTVQVAAAATPSPVTGTSTILSVRGADDGGETNLGYTWTSTGPATVAFATNGVNAAKTCTATFTKAGSYTFAATITDISGLTAMSSAGVTVSQTLGITVTPTATNLMAGTNLAFTAHGADQFGQTMTITAPTWSVNGGGTINPTSGVFCATAVGGPYTVTATAGGKSGTAMVSVYPVLHFQSCEPEISGWGVDFMTMPGAAYEVDWKTNLMSGNWQPYTNLIGSGGIMHVCFTNALPQGFFQIQVTP